ncbi:hypothetical protein [Corynebacterium bovis]|uniref:hypothetical protein n=1 Tax=Corynebacterium bovis TaxID=36808 RepID=UPI000F64C060|nr:hypothetical protein [Corynebacterium bovis]RRQ14153.1 hypothetical protein CXF46_10880 [Corynebacterium bovis]
MNVKRKTSPADAARFEQIKGWITTPEVRLRLQGAATTDQIRAIAAELGIESQGRDMGKFISLIRLIGVDFVGMARDEAAARRVKLGLVASQLDARAGGLPRVRLWSAAVESGENEASTGAFAVVDAAGAVVWYGSFHPDYERIRRAGDLVSAEQSAADRAVYVAYRARQAAGVDEVGLVVTTTCPELDVGALRISGARLGVAVEVVVDDENLVAVHAAEMPGWRGLKDAPDEELTGLVEAVDTTSDTGDAADDADDIIDAFDDVYASQEAGDE